MWEVFWIMGSVFDYGKCFVMWEVFCSVGSVFGFWEVFLDSGKCFGFWEVFWILGSDLDSGKCFVPMGHHTCFMSPQINSKTSLHFPCFTFISFSFLFFITRMSTSYTRLVSASGCLF